MVKRTIFFLWLLLLAGCPIEEPEQESDEDDYPVGACYHTYQDQVLHIDAASDSNQAVIGEIVLSSFVVNSVAINTDSVVLNGASNVEVLGGTLRCTLPCSFGSTAGRWDFMASATGYQDTPQIFDASYATFQGGCPSYEGDGTHVTVIMQLTQ